MSNQYQAYAEYKDSGVEWLGEVPGHWCLKRFKFVANTQKGKLPKAIVSEGAGKFPPYLTMDYLRTGHSDNFVDDKSLNPINEGEVLLLWDGANAGEFIKSRYGVISSTVAHIKFTEKINRSFCWHFVKLLEIELRTSTIGMGIPHVSGEKLNNLIFFEPSLSEQQQIANFLDHETAKIDTLIEKQQQLIKLLKEKRQAVISHAVTKGLNPTALMRDSGVEWLGEVPEHWAMPKVSHIGRVLNGSTPDKTNLSYWDDGTIPWLASSCLNSEIIDEPSLFISEGAYQSCSVELIPENSLLVGMVGQGKTRGSTAILAIDSCINQNMAAIIPQDNIQTRFLYYLFQAMYDDLRELGRGGNQAALNCEIISSVRIPLPPLDEQNIIVTILDELLNKLGDTDILGVEQIELLQERRTALISAAVTGKIDVRHHASHPAGSANTAMDNNNDC